MAVDHAVLASVEEVERMKAYWRGALTTLKTELEGGVTDV